LIQILRINARWRASAGFAAAKVPGVNRLAGAPKRPKTASGTANAAFDVGKMEDCDRRDFTAR
jgi:hypothetical protein